MKLHNKMIKQGFKNTFPNAYCKLAKVYYEILRAFDIHTIPLQRVLGFIKKSRIVPSEEVAEQIVLVKPATEEKVKICDVYNIINNAEFSYRYPSISIWKLHNATFFNNSDIIITEEQEAVWPKYHNHNFSRNIPCDSNLVSVEDGWISYKDNLETIELNACLSLLGVHSTIWAHFLVEYFPKLHFLKEVIENSSEKITIVTPKYSDPQIREIIQRYISQFDVDWLEVEGKKKIIANELFYCEKPTRFLDHATRISLADAVVPEVVASIVKKDLVNPYLAKCTVNEKYRKLFLPRRGGLGKGLLNNDEVEAFFRNEGFYFIEPHKVSLQEKVEIFHSADIIVGPNGSAFTNMLFSRPGTKIMMLTNYQRVLDSYTSFAMQHFHLNILLVDGIDDKRAENPIHASFYIPLQTIKDAYYYMING